MTFDWRPRHAAHAIELMAFNVNFAEPLPQRVMQRLHPRILDTMTGDGVGVDRRIVPGISFVNNALVQDIGGVQFNVGAPDSIGRVIEHVDLQAMSLSYRTWAYSGWSRHRKRLADWLAPSLTGVLEVVPLMSVRLEYQDQFQYTGEPAAADYAQLFSKTSGKLVHEFFDMPTPWHSHTGWYAPSADGQICIHQLNIDIQDLPFPPPPDGKPARWAYMMSAHEDKYGVGSFNPDKLTVGYLLDRADQMHTQLLDLVGSVLTPEAGNAIGLRKSK